MYGCGGKAVKRQEGGGSNNRAAKRSKGGEGTDCLTKEQCVASQQHVFPEQVLHEAACYFLTFILRRIPKGKITTLTKRVKVALKDTKALTDLSNLAALSKSLGVISEISSVFSKDIFKVTFHLGSKARNDFLRHYQSLSLPNDSVVSEGLNNLLKKLKSCFDLIVTPNQQEHSIPGAVLSDNDVKIYFQAHGGGLLFGWPTDLDLAQQEIRRKVASGLVCSAGDADIPSSPFSFFHRQRAGACTGAPVGYNPKLEDGVSVRGMNVEEEKAFVDSFFE